MKYVVLSLVEAETDDPIELQQSTSYGLEFGVGEQLAGVTGIFVSKAEQGPVTYAMLTRFYNNWNTLRRGEDA